MSNTLESRQSPRRAGKNVYAGAILLAVGFAAVACNQGKPNNSASNLKRAEYVLPSDFFLRATARRGPEGEVFIDGSTNLPDGLTFDVQVPSGEVGPKIVVQKGQFHSTGFMSRSPNPNFRPEMSRWPDAKDLRFIMVPLRAGTKKVRFTAYFTPEWQTPSVLKLIGDGGRKLAGEMFKRTDPDVIDSNRTLDYSLAVELPPLAPGAEAINVVKRAVLIVSGMGKSATDIEHNIGLNMKTPGFHPGKGWSANSTGEKTYTVSFDFVTDDKQGEHQALWSVNLATRKVDYINMAAKNLSWTPNY
jgi:hypothetical protein